MTEIPPPSPPDIGSDLKCGRCGRTRPAKGGAEGLPRLSGGWKRIGDATLCDACVGQAYRVIAVTIPINSCASHPWAEFARVAHASFGRVVRVKREVIRKCLESDPTTPTGAKLGKWSPPKSLYADARSVAVELNSGTTAALASQVSTLYKGRRLETHRGERSVPAVRYPQPVPIREQDYTLGTDADGHVVASFRLESTAAEGSARYTVRPLKAKHERAYAVFQSAVRGEVQALEMQVDARERGVEQGHAKGRQDGRTEGGAKTQWVYLLRLVVRVPRSDPRAATRTMHVRTGVPADAELPDSPGVPLLAYRLDDGGPQPPIYMHQVRRQLIRCSREQARLRSDLKREYRVPSRHRKPVGDRQRQFAELRRRLNKSCVNDAGAMVVNYAVRRGVGRLEYDDGSKAWAPSFDWYGLRERLAELCRANGIELVSAAVPDKVCEPQATGAAPDGSREAL